MTFCSRLKVKTVLCLRSASTEARHEPPRKQTGAIRAKSLGIFNCHFIFSVLAAFYFGASGLTSAAIDSGNIDRAYLNRVWQFEDGLPQNSVQAVIQTRDGYIWAGTQKGLARFDGVQFTVFDSGNTKELRTNYITCLVEGKDGSLWIGTDGGGVTRYKDGAFSNFSKSDGLLSDSIKTIFQRKDGSLWISTMGGTSIYKDGAFTWFVPPEGTIGANGWTANTMLRSFCESEDGTLWTCNEFGFFSYKDGTLKKGAERETKPFQSIRSIFLDRQGNVWLGTTEGAHRLSKNGAFTDYSKRHGLGGIGNTILEDRNGNIWLGTYGGLNRLSEGKLWNEVNVEGMAFDVVNSICEDREGNIWAGTKEGLYRLKKRTFQIYTRRDGLGDNNVISVMEDNDGSIWAGTWGGGASRIVNGQVAETISRETHKIRNDLILGLCRTHDDNLWMGLDFDAGLWRIKNGKAFSYQSSEGIIDSAIKVIFEDRDHTLWVGSRSALYQFKDNVFTRYTKANGLAGDMIRVIFQDREGNLWIGTKDGLSLRKSDTFTNFQKKDGLSSDNISAIYQDTEGTLWIGTVGGGLNRFKNGKFTAYTTKEGLFNDDVFDILEDDRGCFWMTCRMGVFQVNKKEFDDLDRGAIRAVKSLSYGKFDGLISLECNNVAKPSACKTRDGCLWFATAKGLAMVDPKSPNLKVDETPPPVMIEKVISDKKPVTELQGYKVTKKAETNHVTMQPFNHVTLPPGRGELEIHYTVLSFTLPEQNRFKYKLAGFDENWIDAGSRRVAYYSNLKPGNYQFQVRGCNKDGVWNQRGASFSFHLAPHFYQSAWFYLACVSMATMSGFGIHRLRIRSLRARQQELMLTVEERTKDLKAEIVERQKVQAENETVHQKLLQTSRSAGMAEVASGVLHNVGNVLNSVNVSANVVIENVRNSKQAGLRKASAMMREHASDLGAFLTTDEKGKQLPSYLAKLSEHLSIEQAAAIKELESLCKNIDHIKDIVAMQQNYARVSGMVESLNLSDLVEDSLRMNAAALARHDVQVVKNFEPVPEIATDKHKVLQILVNLIRNAKYACDEANPPTKRLTVSTRQAGKNSAQIIVSDNGIGIPAENLTRIFSHGFTTRKGGHGFGLHSAALAAKELGGSLMVHSDGPGTGATFTLEIPIKQEKPPR